MLAQRNSPFHAQEEITIISYYIVLLSLYLSENEISDQREKGEKLKDELEAARMTVASLHKVRWLLEMAVFAKHPEYYSVV